jgi:serine protease SohB
MIFPIPARPPRVAVLRLTGVIAARSGGFGAPGIPDATTGPLIERAFRIKRLAALVVVIHWPGGSPVHSSLVASRRCGIAGSGGWLRCFRWPSPPTT